MWLQERLRRECARRRREFAAAVDAQRRKKRKNKLCHEHAGLEGNSAQTESWRVLDIGGELKKESKRDAKAKNLGKPASVQADSKRDRHAGRGTRGESLARPARMARGNKTGLSPGKTVAPLWRIGDVHPKATGCKGVPPLSTGAGQEFDLRLVMQQLRVDRDVAMGLLEANHDPIEAILVYNKPKRAKARLVPPNCSIRTFGLSCTLPVAIVVTHNIAERVTDKSEQESSVRPRSGLHRNGACCCNRDFRCARHRVGSCSIDICRFQQRVRQFATPTACHEE